MRFITVFALVWLFPFGILNVPNVFAQDSKDLLRDEMELTAELIKTKRKLVVLKNINLNEREKGKFWPLYKQFRSSMERLENEKIKMITSYADSYKSESLTDKKALDLLRKAIALRKKKLQIWNIYIGKFEEVLPPKKVVRFYQVESKMDTITDFERSKVIPLVK